MIPFSYLPFWQAIPRHTADHPASADANAAQSNQSIDIDGTDSMDNMDGTDADCNELSSTLIALSKAAAIELPKLLAGVTSIVLITIVGSKFLVHALVLYIAVWAVFNLLNYYFSDFESQKNVFEEAINDAISLTQLPPRKGILGVSVSESLEENSRVSPNNEEKSKPPLRGRTSRDSLRTLVEGSVRGSGRRDSLRTLVGEEEESVREEENIENYNKMLTSQMRQLQFQCDQKDREAEGLGSGSRSINDKENHNLIDKELA